MTYDDFLREKVKEDKGFRAFAVPILGWLLAILVFGFYYPIKYCFVCRRCYDCKNYKKR